MKSSQWAEKVLPQSVLHPSVGFGQHLEKTLQKDPERARREILFAWKAQKAVFRHHPFPQLMPADQKLSEIMLSSMIEPLQHPDRSCIVSILTPCELVQEAGLLPYNVEGFSNCISATRCERGCIQAAEQSGIPDTLCSYHKTFLGAAGLGLLPAPKCIVYTSLSCDANLLSFPSLQKQYDVPAFFLDVPMTPSEEAVEYVAQELQDLKPFLEEVSGHRISEEDLCARVARSHRTQQNLIRYQTLRADKTVGADLCTPLYTAITNNNLLGTGEMEQYSEQLLKDIAGQPPKEGLHLYWMHSIPYWSDALKAELRFSDRAQIVGCDMGELGFVPFDPTKPYEAMARRLVYNGMNGPASRRIQRGIEQAKRAGADGVIWFDHWGCKRTLGTALLAKTAFEEAGLPLLILDGDGCDHSHGGEGQTATRLEAFLEMLEQS